jgi:hypothetical protein
MIMKKELLIKLFLFATCLVYQTADGWLMALGMVHDSVTVKKCNDFTVTGEGSSDKWKGTDWISLVQEGSDNKAYRTRVKVLYSETGIYFLFDCKDKKLTSTMKADNQNLYEEDVVEVFLWADESFPVYFEYELSPFNFELPIMVPNNKGTFLGWLPWRYEADRKTQHKTSVTGGIMKSGGSISGWVAEFFIPFKLLAPMGHVPPVSGTKWRANMYRIDYDGDAKSFAWQEVAKTFHEYNKFGTFVFE